MKFLKHLLFFAFFSSALIQNNFLPYFNIRGYFPNLVFILFFIITFFESKDNDYFWQSILGWENIFLVGVAGFFLDMFSYYYFGLYIFSFFIASVFIKSANYFLKERDYKYLFIYFICLFISSFIVFAVSLSILQIHFAYFGPEFLIGIVYNSVLACGIFWLNKIFFRKDRIQEKQLRLF